MNDKELKVIFIVLPMELGKIMHEHNENFNQEKKNIEKYQREVTEQKNTISKLKQYTGGVQ